MRVHPLLTFGALLVLGGAPALAGRAVTDDERAKLVSAVSAQGCSGGKMEFDDGKYEVDDARCNDGKIYDLDFNPSFELITREAMLATMGAAGQARRFGWPNGDGRPEHLRHDAVRHL